MEIAWAAGRISPAEFLSLVHGSGSLAMANLNSKVEFENRKKSQVPVRGGLQGVCQRKVRL